MKDIILIPTYNEKGNIESIISRVRAEQPRALIIVVDDNSPDGTGDTVAVLSGKDSFVTLHSRIEKTGLGEAYKDVLSKLQEELVSKKLDLRYIVTMDADSSHDPKDISKLISALDTGYDLAIGSRYVKGGKIEGWSKVRFLLSWCGNMYTRIITGSPIHDGTAGFVAFRAHTISNLDFDTISGQGYAYQIEFKTALVKRGGRYIEIPITFIERKIGHSKISGRIILEGLCMPWKILLKNQEK